MTIKKFHHVLLPGGVLSLTVLMAIGGCSDTGDSTDDGSEELEVPDAYEFESRFSEGESSVSYSGQTFRQLLVTSLKNEISAIQSEIEDQKVFEDGEVAARLLFYYEFDSASAGDQPIGMSMDPGPLQVTWNDISSDKDLRGKIAGNDEEGQTVDWTQGMMGWGGMSPDGLVLEWIETLDDMAVAYSSGDIPVDPDGNQIEKFYVSADGLDYQQLMQKFLLGAVNFSQGTDDYLDDDLDGKGLLSDNTMPEEDEPFTALEHGWDEAFGYWGAARDYLDYTPEEIAGKGGRDAYVNGWHDADGDGAIDLESEINFGASVNAGKRDFGSSDSAPTEFAQTTMTAFLTGRAIIASADGELSDEQLADLVEQRDIAIDGWDRAIAATAVHYCNDVVKDMSSADYSFVDYAKHWGELKGFLLSLQFNPRGPLTEQDLEQLHDLVGMAPVAPSEDGAADYAAKVLEARDLLGSAYGFASENLGDENGENGW